MTRIFLTGLAVLAAGQLAYTARLSGELAALRTQVAASGPANQGEASRAPTRPVEDLRKWAISSPRASATADPVTDDRAGADAVRAIVADEMERLTLEKLEQKVARKAETYEELRELVQEHMALPEGPARSLEEVLVSTDAAREEIRSAEKSGELGRDEATEALAALREDARRQIEGVLGEDWATQMRVARERMVEARKTLRDVRGGGGVFWFMPGS